MKFKLTESIIEKLLDRFGLEPIDKDDYFLLTCPACGKKEAFIYKNKEWITCNRKNRCGFTTSIWNLSKEILRDKDIISFIAKEMRDPNFKATDLIERSEKAEIPEGTKFFTEAKEGVVKDRAYNYLKNRGISEETISNLGYVYEPGSRFHQTIFIPFYEDRRLVYFTTRDYTGKNNMRYINPSDLSSKQFIYNYDKIEEGGTVFIFEGIFDAISLKEQIGTVMLSDTLCKSQAIKIVDRAPSRIVFVPDNDEAGEKTLQKNINKILKYKLPSLDFEIFIYYIKGAKDFNETGKTYINIDKCVKWDNNPIKKIKWQNRNFF